jgi:protein-S-isoprenylcysteine O-methyltransferase Ste14
MPATAWEFRHRFWIFAGIFAVGFLAYGLDRFNVVAWAVDGRSGAMGQPANVAIPVLRVVFASTALLAVFGVALRTWAAAYLHADVVYDTSMHHDRVVADGPYRHVRNPLYLGVLLVAVGLTAMTSRLGAAFLLLAVPAFTLRLIAGEEAALTRNGGHAYRDYVAAVPRLLPALRPRLPPGGTRPRRGQAFVGEAYYWGLAASLATFAATVRIEPYLWVLAVAFAVRALLAFGRRRGKRRLAGPASRG